MKRSLADLLGEPLFPLACGEGTNLGQVTSRKVLTWSEWCERLKTPRRSQHSEATFQRLRHAAKAGDRNAKARVDRIKAGAGWYVAGEIEGETRDGETVRTRGAVVLDDDAATTEMLQRLKAAEGECTGLAYFVHETHASTEAAPRVRIIVPLSEPVGASEYPAVARAVARMLGYDPATLDRASFEAARLMYWPSRPVDSDYWCHANDGAPLDPRSLCTLEGKADEPQSSAADADLATIAHNRRQFESFEALADAVRAVKNDDRFESRDAWRDVLAAIHFESGGSEKGRQLAHEWSATWSGYDPRHTDATWESLRDNAERRLATGRLIIKYAREDGWRPRAKPGVIVVRAEELNENLATLDAAMHSEELGFYRRAGMFVHVQREREPAIFEGEKTEAWAERVVQTTPAQMQQLAMQACAFEAFDGRSKKNKLVQCPSSLAAHYLQMVAPSDVPVLRALLSRPTIRPDGSVLQTRGFDPDTGLLLHPDIDFPRVPDAPTKDDARAALRQLKRPVRGFEFGTDLDRTVWLSAVLTALVRDSLPRAPFFAFDAPLPGSGKTILAAGVSVIARGFTAAPTSQTDPDEERKTVASLLLRNSPFLLIDNCERPIQSSTLCEIATSPEWEARLLGTNIAPKLPTNIMVLFTGNNLEIVGDIIERTLICRLQPTTGRPSERSYGWSFEAECKDRRAELVAAGLTIIRAFLASGADPGLKPSRFPEWERFARLPLVWLDEGDVLDTVERLRQVAAEADTDGQYLAKLVDAWWRDHRDRPVRLGEISGDSNAGELFSLLRSRYAGERFDGINARAAREFLARHKGQIVEGKYFDFTADAKRGGQWRLLRVRDAA